MADERLITLVTDFGTADGYAGALVGVIAGIAPAARVVPVTHDLPPGDLLAAQLALATVLGCYPPLTIHLVVVDPGVGGPRRGLALQAGDQLAVGPDNGVLTPLLLAGRSAGVTMAAEPRISDTAGTLDVSATSWSGRALAARVVALAKPLYQRRPVSATFHGRDVFAPAAAYLASGIPLDALGPAVADPLVTPLPEPRPLPDGAWQGQVLLADRFGNLLTNLRPPPPVLAGQGPDPAQAGQGWRIELPGGRSAPLVRTYAEAPDRDAPIALVGSSGRLELAVRDGSAAAWWRATLGAEPRGAALSLQRLR